MDRPIKRYYEKLLALVSSFSPVLRC